VWVDFRRVLLRYKDTKKEKTKKWLKNRIQKKEEQNEKRRNEMKTTRFSNRIQSIQKKYLVENLERRRVPWRRVKNLRSRGMSERNKADISWWSQRASQISNRSKITFDYFRHSCDISTTSTAKQKKRRVPANVLQYNKKQNKQSPNPKSRIKVSEITENAEHHEKAIKAK
jgi:hypothetical protein